MFKSLTDRMGQALRNVRGLGKITEENVSEALKDVRSALLSADVHFKVVKEFIERVKNEALGEKVTKSVDPGQQIIKIISDELTKLLGEGSTDLLDKKPLRVMLVGLHGSGKTTTTGKIAKLLSKKNYKPALVACDVYRPAAIDQLHTIAQKENFPFYAQRDTKDVAKIGRNALDWAKSEQADLILFDTAGRLQIDNDLIEEIKDLKKIIQPDEVLLVADSALGQEAVNVAKHFHEAVHLTGIVLTKLDGDARGGAALSMKSVTGVPIKLVGHGEKMEDIDIFYPERMAQRILGMGDIVSLVEKAQEHVDQEEAERLAKKMQKAEFDFHDFLSQIRQVKKMGPLTSLMGMMPGMSGLNMNDSKPEKMMNQTEAIIQSMTNQERANPQLLNASRRARIAKGSGLTLKDVNALIKQFSQMKKMMQKMKGGKQNKMMQKMSQLMGKDDLKLPGNFKL